MKRFLLSSLLLLATGRAAFAYVNDSVVMVPTMNPELIQLDTPDGIFVNNGTFNVAFPQTLGGPTILYETSSTRNYTNNGTMTGSPGFDFENFPASVGKATNAESFVNTANGFGGGTITAINAFGGLNIFQQGGLFVGSPATFDLAGLAMVKVRATNIVDNGLITLDSTGLIDLVGKELNLDRARFVMTGGGGVNVLDWGGGGFTTNSSGWAPAFDLTPTTAVSPIFTNNTGLIEQMALFGATPYFQDLNPQPGPDNTIVWRIIYLQDSSPTNVSTSVFFGNSAIGDGAFHVQWTGVYRDPFTGGTATNYFVFSDVPEQRRGPFFFNPPTVPADFSFASSLTPLVVGIPAVPGYSPVPFAPLGVTNDFTYINAQPTALSVSTNQIIGGNPTNLPGRIQFTSSGSLNLANVHITGDNYVSLNAPVNYLGNSNSMITAPWADLNLGVTNGSLTVSNLLTPELPGFTTADFAPNAVFPGVFPNGGIQAFSGSYFFVTTNLVGTNAIAITNDVRVLMINSALQPTLPALQKDVKFHAPNNLVISDHLNIDHSFFSDTTSLTITTNANSAYSLQGALIVESQDIFLSGSLSNLQYLTNFGAIGTKNLTDFAGNMLSPFSPRSGATPLQAFINHGGITNQGLFVLANTFVNSGQIFEMPNGNIDIGSAGAVIATNGAMFATNGSMSIVADSILISNSIINAGRSLTLTPACSLSDGYVLSNMFGHATNVTLPNLVTNGNFLTVGGGVRVTFKPATADLLGTTITNISVNSLDSINQWAGEDRGATPSGFADNLALGRMIFVSDGNPSQFTFRSLPGMNNAIYIDSIELQGGATNTDVNGNYTTFNIEPGIKVYYAQALANGASIAQKLNGKNGGGFLWVSNYAGVYSSTNLAYTDGNTYIFNEALVISPNINTDGDGQVNRDDPEPIPAGLTFDISVVGPQSCGVVLPPPPPPPVLTNSLHTPGLLTFPPHQNQSQGNEGVPVSFAVAQGSYNGLFYETNGVNPAHSGFFTAKVTSKGNFSGKLLLGGKTYSVGKAFSPSGDYTSLVTAKGSTTPLNVTLHLVNNDQIVGEVSGSGWTAQLLAVIETSAAASKNSLLLSATNDGSSTTVSGDSFGTMSVNKNGAIQWSGVLPDGVKVSQKSALSKGGIWPMYSSLYGGSGSLIGWLRLTNNSDIGGSAVWILPANQNKLYPNGLTNNLNATGSTVANPHALSRSTIVLSGPQLASPLTNSVTISGKTGQNADKSLTLSVDIKNGLFTGSVTDPDSGQKLSFQGALLEKSGIGGGFFLNANKDQGGKVSLAPAN